MYTYINFCATFFSIQILNSMLKHLLGNNRKVTVRFNTSSSSISNISMLEKFYQAFFFNCKFFVKSICNKQFTYKNQLFICVNKKNKSFMVHAISPYYGTQILADKRIFFCLQLVFTFS